MRTPFLALLLFCIAGCNDPGGKPPDGSGNIPQAPKKDAELSYLHVFADTTLENRITGALMKLPFVKKSNAYIDSISGHRHGIAFLLDSTGNNDHEISVQAGYNGDMRFETYFRFFVNPQTLEIKVYDVVNDRKLAVKDYIKSQQQP